MTKTYKKLYATRRARLRCVFFLIRILYEWRIVNVVQAVKEQQERNVCVGRYHLHCRFVAFLDSFTTYLQCYNHKFRLVSKYSYKFAIHKYTLNIHEYYERYLLVRLTQEFPSWKIEWLKSSESISSHNFPIPNYLIRHTVYLHQFDRKIKPIKDTFHLII